MRIQPSTPKKDRFRWLPPIAWMGVIVVLSTEAGSAEHTGRILVPLLSWTLPWASPLQVKALHSMVRRAAHFTEYALMTALWFRALTRNGARSPGAAAWAALAFSIGWAGIDELHQAFVLGRRGSLADVALDAAGGATAAGLARWGWQAVEAATTGLLWTGAVGGALILGVNLLAGVSSGVLWVTVPAAAVAILLLRRRRRRRA